MADKKEPKQEFCHLSVCCAENGYKLCVCYEREQSLSERAGWVPAMPGETKDFVAKSKAELKKIFAQIIDES